MNYKIIMDSAGDIQKLHDANFQSVPLKILVGQQEFVDDANLDISHMVDVLKNHKGKSGTACPGVGEYLEAFGEAENVFCVTITSNLSGSYGSAKIAAQTYEEEHPGRRAYVVDSLSTGPEMIMMAEKIYELVKQELPFDQIVETVEAYKQKTHLVFSLESLMNLANNGRVSMAVAKIAGILGIRVVGKASDVGTLEQLDKSRGEKKAISDLMKRMLELGYQGGPVLIHHCQNPGAAQAMETKIREQFGDAEIRIGELGGLCSFYAELGGMLIGFES